MKIAYFGYDFFAACLDVASENNEVIALYSYLTDDKYNFNRQIFSKAEKLKLAVNLHRPSLDDFNKLKNLGCELIVSAGYPYRIYAEESGIKGINIHPSLLPEGRGPWPLPYAILNDLPFTGVSVHKISSIIDGGEIVVQEAFPLDHRDNLESVSCRSQMLAVKLLRQVLIDFDKHWNKSVPQGVGSYWPFPSPTDMKVKWNQSVHQVSKTVRAFGKLESSAEIDGKHWSLQDVTGWQEDHHLSCGAVVHRTQNEVVIAVKDGFVCVRFAFPDSDFQN